jgi:hypothetical protein
VIKEPGIAKIVVEVSSRPMTSARSIAITDRRALRSTIHL